MASGYCLSKTTSTLCLPQPFRLTGNAQLSSVDLNQISKSMRKACGLSGFPSGLEISSLGNLQSQWVGFTHLVELRSQTHEALEWIIALQVAGELAIFEYSFTLKKKPARKKEACLPCCDGLYLQSFFKKRCRGNIKNVILLNRRLESHLILLHV